MCPTGPSVGIILINFLVTCGLGLYDTNPVTVPWPFDTHPVTVPWPYDTHPDCVVTRSRNRLHFISYGTITVLKIIPIGGIITKPVWQGTVYCLLMQQIRASKQFLRLACACLAHSLPVHART